MRPIDRMLRRALSPAEEPEVGPPRRGRERDHGARIRRTISDELRRARRQDAEHPAKLALDEIEKAISPEHVLAAPRDVPEGYVAVRVLGAGSAGRRRRLVPMPGVLVVFEAEKEEIGRAAADVTGLAMVKLAKVERAQACDAIVVRAGDGSELARVRASDAKSRDHVVELGPSNSAAPHLAKGELFVKAVEAGRTEVARLKDVATKASARRVAELQDVHEVVSGRKKKPVGKGLRKAAGQR